MLSTLKKYLLLVLLVVKVAPASSTTPPELEWNFCAIDGYHYSGTLYFCQAGSYFGYSTEADPLECGALAPLIRVEPGKSYQLRLVNDAQESTNLHTHGLHIPGNGNADDITRLVAPGNCLYYNWTIPEDHMGGTHWYHAHLHEFTSAHFDGGAFGMLIVEDTANNNDKPAWFAREHSLLLSDSVAGVRANGEVQELLDITAGEWNYVRVLVADKAARERPIHFDSNCVVHPMAYDGVYRSKEVDLTPTADYYLTGASRIDLAVKCQEGVAGIYYDTVNENRDPLVALTVTAAVPPVDEDIGSWDTWISVRPDYLQDLSSATIDGTWEISMSGGNINGESWDAEVPQRDNVAFGTVEEWRLLSSDAHPFHIHLYHFQVVTDGGCGFIYEQGEFYDTISADATDCRIRIPYKDIGGRTVLHCHILNHEDNGSMTWINVVGGPQVFEKDFDTTACDAGCFAGSSPPPPPPPPPTCGAPEDSCKKDRDCCSDQCSGKGSSKQCA